MTGAAKPERAPSGAKRAWAALLGLALLVPLGTAYHLEPSPLNRGTHQQLGFPPCSFVVMYGQRCPACGMTTSWAHLVRGQLISAFRANAGGTLLGLLDVVAVAWLLLSAARGRWLGWTPNTTAAAWVATAILIVTLVDWSVRLMGH